MFGEIIHRVFRDTLNDLGWNASQTTAESWDDLPDDFKEANDTAAGAVIREWEMQQHYRDGNKRNVTPATEREY